ncbi:hypothetical protein GCM10022261_07520 [Brevibacterium daeguense]|uniref:Uncharacterized protein n=1 Tax=Brevibacterium daeguense TaxID=909936 RepID=A0ABP8EGY7_9MICO|nr:DUF6882 domain-containing protein [Brevibacterium daeguense]
MSDSLQNLVNRAIFLSTEMQTHFGLGIVDAGLDFDKWEVDFSEHPSLQFTGDEPLTLRAHLIGTHAAGQGSWHWGWDNVNDFPEPVVALSHAVRRHGAAHDIAELTTDEITADEELPLRLILAAKEITGKWAHYPASAGGGTVVWMLVEGPQLQAAAPKIKQIVRSLAQGLTETTVTDHREALQAYSERRGFPLMMLPGGGLRILAEDGSADVTFDEHNRITECLPHLPLEGEAAEQFAEAAAAQPTAAPEPAPVPEPVVAAPVPEPAPAAEAPTVAPVPEPVSETPEPEPVAEAPAPETAPEAPAPEPEPVAEAPEPIAEAPAPEPEPVTEAPAAIPEPTVAPEPSPAPAPAPTPASEPAAEPAEAAATDEEARDEEAPRKKGFFKRLFGR